MSDFTTSKPAGPGVIQSDGSTLQGGQFPDGVISTPWGRLEPLLTPDQLKSRYLKGIPLTLKIKDPETNLPYKITDDELKDYIERALGTAEDETGLILMPTQVQERHPFQLKDYQMFGFFQLLHKPVGSIERLEVVLADGSNVFSFPLSWIETGNLVRGQLNVLPLLFTGLNSSDSNPSSPSSGALFTQVMNYPWVPALFTVTYTAGYKNGLVPKTINDLVGTIAAMRTLSQLAAAYAHISSNSLSMDGMAQSVSTPGPARYQVRMGELAEERKLLVRKSKKAIKAGIVVGTV